ncbi:type II secretion protein F [Achromobacter spanius]|jgi:tight adherence protein B|uniref:Type II secretion protein F n=1 Tax=Achromobacter spanius TaxID=217203 RepID=A0A2S5GQ44_9BURK|nr:MULTISPECIES: type II secretion system F family protein [Achromobacter]AYD65598.1 type II secretion protein F [Achromobacter sp. B7]MDX3985410.1 type II secretion system F family protein [Achromobacter sp.]PPA74971.1 type II secretion protein F [Achromobacter spanius]QYJ19733.1 type II secretion system F family protein [Achromobacter sp. ES-001]
MQDALILGALALVMASGAVLLWRHANSGARRAASSAFLENQLKRGREAPEETPFAEGGRAMRSGFSSWDRLLLLAGVRQSPGFYLRTAVPVVLGAVLAWVFLGPLSGVVSFVMLAVLMYFLLWLRADKRRRRMIAQLPAFLDNIVRLITIGNSMGAAFQTAAATTDQPLLEVVETAASLSRSAKELDAALVQVSRMYGLKELYMVAAVVSLAMRFGGRSDQVLERMAAFMRDVAQARNELSASSAEVRLSAWILALLPVGIAGFIIVANNKLFMGLWEDPLGFKMLLTAVVLQIGGCYWLYRMAKSI